LWGAGGGIGGGIAGCSWVEAVLELMGVKKGRELILSSFYWNEWEKIFYFFLVDAHH
jgi:hypothetical protein